MDKSVGDAVGETYSLLKDVISEVVNIVTSYGLDVLGALAILIVGVWVSKKAARITGTALKRTDKIDDTLTSFFTSMVRYVVLVLVGVAVLNQFGVQTASLIAVVGAAGLAIGLALQGTLSNVAAGVMLLLFRPFKVGHYVEVAGVAGTIKELNLFFTVMATPDNVQIIVPNGKVWGDSITNYSANDTRRVDFVLGVSYDADLDKTHDSIMAVIATDARIKADPEPMVAVSEMADSSVNFVTRVWVDAGDYWGVKFDLTKAFKERFDQDGIDIPYPTRTLHMVSKKDG